MKIDTTEVTSVAVCDVSEVTVFDCIEVVSTVLVVVTVNVGLAIVTTVVVGFAGGSVAVR
jgi:hypothetical protein